MSTVEERLARDIEAVTGGVVVTESDLTDAREGVMERLELGRERGRRRTVGAVVAAAGVVPLVGLAVARSLDSDRSVAPLAPVTPSTPVETITAEPDGWLTGRAPTPALVQGVWREDNGGVQMRFAADGAFASDDRGRIFLDPGLAGTWELTGDTITIDVTGGAAGCAGQTVVMRLSLAEKGVLHDTPTKPAPTGCAFLGGTWGALEQVLPTSPAIARFRNSDQESWTPWPRRSHLDGLWMVEGGGYAMQIGTDGSYVVADRSGEPVDRGRWSFQGTQLTLTSTARSVACSQGDRLVWSGVEQLNPGTFALRATVRDNTCHAPWAATHWIMIPDSRTP
jgi:hypothetical protein